MAEISCDHAKKLMRALLPLYNMEHGTDFEFASVDTVGADHDVLCRSLADKETTLKIQVVESVPARGEDLAEFKKFQAGKSEGQVLHVQSDDLRVEESLGHKLNKYPSVDLQKDLVILIDFGLFPWTNDNLPAMKEKGEWFKGAFPAVYCVHIDPDICERLA